MCFSTSASFTAAGVISFVGVLAVLKARQPKLKMFASIPIIFGVQQFFEGIVWLTLTTGSYGFFNKLGIYGFIFFANIFWPIWLPSTLLQLETHATRCRLLKIMLGLGIFFALIAFITAISYGRTAEIIDHHIVYPFLTSPFYSKQHEMLIQNIESGMIVVYFIATVGALFTSSVKGVWFIGLLIALGFIISGIAYFFAFGSVWCFFAALSSIFIYYIIDKIEIQNDVENYNSLKLD